MSVHKIHASPASGKGGNSFDIGDVRWRGEGGDGAVKREQAYRLAFTWNWLAELAAKVRAAHDAHKIEAVDCPSCAKENP